MQDLAGVAHSEVDLSVFLEPPAIQMIQVCMFAITSCDFMVHHHMQEKTCYH